MIFLKLIEFLIKKILMNLDSLEEETKNILIMMGILLLTMLIFVLKTNHYY